MTRTRTYSWEDPQVFVDAADGLTGLEFLNKIGAGELPLVPAGATTSSPSQRGTVGRGLSTLTLR